MGLSFRNNTRGSVGLDLDSGYLAAVQVSHDHVSRAASAGLEAGIIAGGEVSDPDALTAVLRDFFRRESLPRSVRLGVANQQIVLRRLELPPIEDEDERTAAVRFQAAEAIPMPLDDVVLDHQVTGRRTDEEGHVKMQLIVVAARRAMVGAFVDCVRDAGLKPVGMDLDAFALVRALAAPSVSDEVARVYCHLAGVTTLAIAVGSACHFSRVLPDAGAGAEVSADALAEEVRLSVDTYAHMPGAVGVGDVMLSGPYSRRDGLAHEMSHQLSVQVEHAQPLGRLSPNGNGSIEEPDRHTVAAGLALGAAA
ncbi:MAG: pilus assembly protein PilM [Thermoleophilaceae bacterium]